MGAKYDQLVLAERIEISRLYESGHSSRDRPNDRAECRDDRSGVPRALDTMDFHPVFRCAQRF